MKSEAAASVCFLPRAQPKGVSAAQREGMVSNVPVCLLTTPSKEDTEGGIAAFKNLTSKHTLLAQRGRQGSYRGMTAGQSCPLQ